MGTSLEDLLKIDGVVAAGDFTLDGKVVEFASSMDMSRELAEMSAQFCATVTQLFHTLGGAFTKLGGMSWSPQQGWAYSGGEYTVAVGGTRGVFIETAKADFNRLFATLIGER